MFACDIKAAVLCLPVGFYLIAHAKWNSVSVLCLQSWLRMYGYLPQASRQMSTMRSAQILSSAVSDMQRFYGLEVTGKMDPETIRLGLSRLCSDQHPTTEEQKL